MKKSIAVLIIMLFSFTTYSISSLKGQTLESDKATSIQKVKLEDLLKSKLEGVEDTEVVVSRVTIPPNTSLPKHWHPGEEFAYILDGSVVLRQEGKDDVIGKKGDVLKVPLKQIHTALTKDLGATILVFRIHELGKPQRTIVK